MIPEKSIFITEEEKLKLHLKTTYTERFYLLMQLIKASKKIKNAKITKADH